MSGAKFSSDLDGSGPPQKPLHPPLERPLLGGWAFRSVEALVACVSLFLCVRPIWDPDSYWHLAVGREMAWRRRWLTTETFSFTAAGQPWEDTEWLFHAFLYPLHRVGGDTLLVALTALGAILALLQMGRLVRLVGGGALAFGLAALAVLPPLADRVRCRPDLVTFVFMGILAELLWRNFPRDRAEPPPFLSGGRPLWHLSTAMALLFGLWANLHGGWAYGSAFLAACLAGAILDRGLEGPILWRQVGRAVAVGAAACGALFLTPYGWRIPWFPFRHVLALADPSLVPIEEWNPTPLWGYRGFLLACSALLIVVMALRRRPMALILPAGLQVILGILWVRYPALAFLTLAPLAVGEAVACRPLPRPWMRTMARSAGWTALGVGSLLMGMRGAPDVHLRWDLSRWYPEGEVRFLQRHQVRGNLLNPYTSGGYLDWYYYPLGKVFMDGRYFPFTGVLSEYFEAHRTLDGFHEFLDRWGVELALHPYPEYSMPPDAPGRPPRGALRQLYPPGEWAAVHFGAWGGLFLRRLPRWEGLIAEREYRLLVPDDALHLRWAVRRGEVDPLLLTEELRRCLKEAPRIPNRRELERTLEACDHAP